MSWELERRGGVVPGVGWECRTGGGGCLLNIGQSVYRDNCKFAGTDVGFRNTSCLSAQAMAVTMPSVGCGCVGVPVPGRDDELVLFHNRDRKCCIEEEGGVAGSKARSFLPGRGGQEKERRRGSCHNTPGLDEAWKAPITKGRFKSCCLPAGSAEGVPGSRRHLVVARVNGTSRDETGQILFSFSSFF